MLLIYLTKLIKYIILLLTTIIKDTFFWKKTFREQTVGASLCWKP